MIISVMLARQTTSLRILPASLSSLHSVNWSLLPLFFRSSPFRISNLQPLFAKHPGWGTPNLSALAFGNLPSPLLLITYQQAQHFHAITHSFARWMSSIPSVFNSFRTLFYRHRGWYPLPGDLQGWLAITGQLAPLGPRHCDGQSPQWKSWDLLRKRSGRRSRP